MTAGPIDSAVFGDLRRPIAEVMEDSLERTTVFRIEDLPSIWSINVEMTCSLSPLLEPLLMESSSSAGRRFRERC
jgi:hypothetical protein